MSNEVNFEELLKRIEEINLVLEKGDLTLSESLKAYEEGVSLTSKCYEILKKAKLQIEEVDPTNSDGGVI